jgi:hypothetical protein
MDHIDLAAKDHWWPHQIQQIESRAHMEKHGVRHTGSRAEPDLVTHGIAALVGGLAGRAQCKRRWKKNTGIGWRNRFADGNHRKVVVGEP